MNTIFKNKLIKSKIFILIFLFFLGAITSFSLEPYGILIINFITYPLFFLIFKKFYYIKKFSFFIGCSFGFGYFLFSLYWISYSLTHDDIFKPFIPIALIFVPIFLSIFYGISLLLCSFFNIKNNIYSILLFSLSISLLEYLRGFIFTGFPWNLISYSLVNFNEVIQILSFIGTYSFNLITITFFLSPLVILFNISKINKLYIFLSLIILFSCNLVFGIKNIENINNSNKKKLNIILKIISPRIELERYFIDERPEKKIEELIKYMETDINQKTLFVLPEGILSGIYLEALKYFANKVENNFSSKHFILIGINSEENNKIYNSMVLLDNEFNVLKKYNKNKLVPFGEYLPFENILKKFGLKKVTQGYRSFSKSNDREIITLDDLSILPLICYEIIYSGNITKKKHSFDIIINISEDGWFGNSIGPHQHFASSIFRSIEEGKNILRSSNNGISAIVNPNGVVEKRIESTHSGVISIDSIKVSKETLFSKLGNKIFFYFVLIYITLIFFLKKKEQ